MFPFEIQGTKTFAITFSDESNFFDLKNQSLFVNIGELLTMFILMPALSDSQSKLFSEGDSRIKFFDNVFIRVYGP